MRTEKRKGSGIARHIGDLIGNLNNVNVGGTRFLAIAIFLIMIMMSLFRSFPRVCEWCH